ncbi:MAG: hypothetical protein PHX68_05170 [Alphaproteobacteria bacterium]|nr:hypothetical protein [Alphaproteobacteria bacterium]
MSLSEQKVSENIRDTKFDLDIVKNRRNILTAFAILCAVVSCWHLARHPEDRRVVRENTAALAASVGVGILARHQSRQTRKMQWKLQLLRGRRERLLNRCARTRAS